MHRLNFLSSPVVDFLFVIPTGNLFGKQGLFHFHLLSLLPSTIVFPSTSSDFFGISLSLSLSRVLRPCVFLSAIFCLRDVIACEGGPAVYLLVLL